MRDHAYYSLSIRETGFLDLSFLRTGQAGGTQGVSSSRSAKMIRCLLDSGASLLGAGFFSAGVCVLFISLPDGALGLTCAWGSAGLREDALTACSWGSVAYIDPRDGARTCSWWSVVYIDLRDGSLRDDTRTCSSGSVVYIDPRDGAWGSVVYIDLRGGSLTCS